MSAVRAVTTLGLPQQSADWVQFQVIARLGATPNLLITTLALQRLEHLMQVGIQ
jgi:hypothetical protein